MEDQEYLRIIDQERRDYERQVVRAGEQRLGMVGLTLEDLRGCKTVLDIGACEGFIARAAKFSGLNCRVVSIDIEPMPLISSEGLESYQFDAAEERQWPPSLRQQVDLAISKQGPLFQAKKELVAKAALDAALKSLSKEKNFGLRVFPIRFGFVVEEMLETNPEYARLKSMSLKQLLKSKENDDFNSKANEQTVSWLKAHKYNYDTGAVKQPGEMRSNSKYLIIRP